MQIRHGSFGVATSRNDSNPAVAFVTRMVRVSWVDPGEGQPFSPALRLGHSPYTLASQSAYSLFTVSARSAGASSVVVFRPLDPVPTSEQGFCRAP